MEGLVINPDGGVNPCCIIDDPNSDFDNTKNNLISKYGIMKHMSLPDQNLAIKKKLQKILFVIFVKIKLILKDFLEYQNRLL